MSGAELEDRRRHNFYIVDNEVIDDYAELIPENRRADALAVYCVLARHADAGGRAWPGTAYIGRKIGRSRPTVIDAVKELGKLGLVGKEERPNTSGGQATNVYTLPPVSKGGGVNDVDRGCKQDLQGGVNTVNTKKTHREEDPKKNSRRDARQADASPDAPQEKANWMGVYCREAKRMGVSVSDEDRERVPGNLARCHMKEGASDTEMNRLINHMLGRRIHNVILSPQEALNDVRGIPSGKRRSGTAAPSIAVVGAKEEDYDESEYSFHA